MERVRRAARRLVERENQSSAQEGIRRGRNRLARRQRTEVPGARGAAYRDLKKAITSVERRGPKVQLNREQAVGECDTVMLNRAAQLHPGARGIEEKELKIARPVDGIWPLLQLPL